MHPVPYPLSRSSHLESRIAMFEGLERRANPLAGTTQGARMYIGLGTAIIILLIIFL